MGIYIHDIVTANPETSTDQITIRNLMKEGLGKDRLTQAIIHRLYSQSGINKRYTFLNYLHKDSADTFVERALSVDDQPTTYERNEIYKIEASKLFLEIGEKLLDQNPSIQKKDITHVITVSCTGFYAPGPDFDVVQGLGLSPNTHRFHLGFMGCYAALPALKMAKSFCEADADATVLVICNELCTLHLQNKSDSDSLIAFSVFADGAAGALVSTKQPAKRGYDMVDFATSLAYEGEKDMAWTIGNTGFNMILSSYVPDIIASNLENVLAPLFEKLSISKNDVDLWAVHPGGRAIVDKVEQGMELSENQVSASRKVLAEFGNMSSVTVLFVLKEILNSKPEAGSTVLPMAFGPGLTIESGLLKVTS
ncbi:MAG: type III polyketide synthase [Balneolaceae bacterium]|nr:type III polyketide synthase [Balneolaceae bacterium]MBO6545955.1 type III polyketide synthase [Balneolaceae bacterium]MBO6647351.1 type III polyketide synthase [Balneolaceae bacterium]